MNTKEQKEELIKIIGRYFEPSTVPTFGKFAEYLIANGVSIPVRCRECKYNLYGGCRIEWEIRQDSDDWNEQFCSEGVRDG